MHVVIVTGEGEVTQADRLAWESFSLALPFVLVWTLWAVEVVTAEGKKWLALAGTRTPIRARFGKMGRRERALQIEDRFAEGEGIQYIVV